jgi:transcriptional regulator with XRE-family HTH domain
MHTMITVEQIKAARGLLEWSQDDLADAAILSRPAINNLERRVTKPHTNTLERIQKALEKAGIEFIDGGVRYRKQILNVEVMEGDMAFLHICDDIYETLQDAPSDEKKLLVSGCDERKFEAIAGEKVIQKFDMLRNADIVTLLLVQEGDTYFLEPEECYRWVPEEIFTQVSNFVYGDKYAIILWGPPLKIVLIHNSDTADSYRKQFYAHWNRAKLPVTD